MRMYLNKSFKKILLLLVLVTGVLGGLTQSIVEGQVVSGVVDNTTAANLVNNSIIKKYQSKLSITYDISSGIQEILNSPKDVVKKNIQYVGQDKKKAINLRILPFITNPKDSALYDLETYLLNYVGVGEKYLQNEYTLGNKQIAQIAFNLYIHGEENYFTIYTSIKNQNKTYILTTGYTTQPANLNALDSNNSESIKHYNDTIKSFNIEKQAIDRNEFNVMDRNNLNSLVVEIYKDLNKYYLNTI